VETVDKHEINSPRSLGDELREEFAAAMARLGAADPEPPSDEELAAVLARSRYLRAGHRVA
jgi:hypothetical protein